MADYPDLSSLTNTSGIGGLLAVPNASYPYFWTWILASFFFIITFSTYFSEKERRGVGYILSSMAVASFATIVLATIGTIVGFITLEIMISILVFGLLIIGVWFFFSGD
jgi:uncharacterized protein YacL